MNPARVITVTETGQWLVYQHPEHILLAEHPADVKGVLEQAELLASQGLTALGYVSYEAAPAFDPALVVKRGTLPLAAFAVFTAAEPMTPPPLDDLQGASVDTDISFPEYQQAFMETKRQLAAGNTYQVNLTHSLNLGPVNDPEHLFARLVARQPTRYAMYMELPGVTLCSVSPELFFRRSGDRIYTEPMKGTRPRSADTAQDRELKTELQHSEKDRAENLMIVDMIRNDLGRIAKPGSIKVDALFEIKTMPTVYQQVSRVSADSDASIAQIFAALFPCASVTGAPKANTMNIIHDLEVAPRGIYTGAVGKIGPGGDAEFAVAIRTVTVKPDAQATYGIGGGIVWQSDLFDEWRESLDKAAILTGSATFSLLETLRYEPNAGIWLLQAHLDRLAGSAAHFGFSLKPDEVRKKLLSLQFSKPTRVRLLVDISGQMTVEHAPLTSIPTPVRLKLAAVRVRSEDIFLQHKTTQRAVYEQAKLGLTDCDDVVLLNESGEVTETTIFNIFIPQDGTLLTPPLQCGLLAGTFRRQLLQDGKAAEAIITLEMLQNAPEIYVGNSVRGLLPAVLV